MSTPIFGVTAYAKIISDVNDVITVPPTVNAPNDAIGIDPLVPPTKAAVLDAEGNEDFTDLPQIQGQCDLYNQVNSELLEIEYVPLVWPILNQSFDELTKTLWEMAWVDEINGNLAILKARFGV
jgi:hypothetical protein